MKKIILLIAFALSAGAIFSQVTCPPTPVPFSNTDLLQIWCKTGTSSGTQTVVPQLGSTFTITGNVGGFSTKKHYTIPTTTVTYNIGDCVGGDVQIENLRRFTTSNYIIYEVAFFDSTGHTPDLDVTFLSFPYANNFNNTPTQFTNDMNRYLGNVHINTTDWTVTGITSRASIRYVGIICTGIELYAIITTNTSITFPTKTCFNMKIGALQD